ncbi:hypothetical protein AAZV13_03G049700 [Glycine max]
MIDMRILHELTNYSNNKGNIRSCNGKINELSYKSPIPLRIRINFTLICHELQVWVHRTINRSTILHACFLQNIQSILPLRDHDTISRLSHLNTKKILQMP